MGEVLSTGALATGALLAFVRLGAFFFAAPFPGPGLPVQVRVILSAALAFALARPGPEPSGGLWLAAIGEVVLGAAAGALLQLAVHAFTHAGEAASAQIGVQSGSFVGLLGAQVSSFGGLFGLLALALFVVGEGPARMMTFLWRWLELVPPGAAAGAVDGFGITVAAGRELFVVALAAGAPVVASVFAAQVVLAILARAVPSLNLFVEGPALTLGTGVLGLIASVHTLAPLVDRAFAHRFEQLLGWLGA
jgi:flagellar biosynthetic protein FliR